MVVNVDGRIECANHLAPELFGYQIGELTGRTVDILIPERARERHIQHRANYMANPSTQSFEDRRELSARCKDGREFPADITLRPLDTGDGPRVLVTVRDITRRRREEQELRQSQQQLRELSERLITVSDEERTRLSRTIHDELGQMMTGLKMDLAWLQRHLEPHQGALLKKTRAMSALLDKSIHSVRQISTELRPGILDDFGLEAAVEWQLQEYQDRTDTPCTISSEMQNCAPGSSRSNAAICILKEALTNITRHAQASQVEVFLRGDADLLTLVVRDNGRGISKSEIQHPSSIGLLGMRERARMYGGTLSIAGTPGQGSTVTLRLPLKTGE